MLRKLFFIAVVFVLTVNASAGIVTLPDSTLLAFGDVGGTGASTLDATIDIAGDPGVQFDITFADQSGWTDIALGKYSPTGIGLGDTVEMEVKNLDTLYSTAAKLYMQVDGWVYYQGTGVWISPGATATISIVNPSDGTSIDSIGLKLGTDDWTGRPAGSSVSVQVVPEPATLLLMGLGGLGLLRRRK